MKRLFIILAILSGLTLNATAQNTGKQKKVAVVLSGGGAKGMAHIGVLKVLERAGIPVDIITGTSMGSIVGGLYATGISAERLDTIVRAQDWSYVLSDRDDLSHQSLREREHQNTYILSTSLSWGKKKKTIEGGIILGKNIGRLFAELTSPYNDSIDFNKLPIPFACVSTNIVDNTEYVFHRGILSRAMRASMAIPGVFSPVRMNGMVLVDGGLRNNFPTDIAKEMGADFIIGSSVKEPDRTAEDLKSTSNILLQLVDLNCKNKFEENLAIADIPIIVDVEGYSAASFSAAAVDTLIRRGEEAAMAHWDELVALKEQLEQTGHIKPRPRILITPKPMLEHVNSYKIGELRFENMTKSDEHFIRTKFRLHEGDSIDSNRANLITTSMRLDLFYKFADYRIINNAVQLPDGSSVARVVFIAGEKQSNLMSLGVRFDNEELVAMQANAAFPISSKMPMELDFTLRLGKRIMARVDWGFHPMSFLRPTISYTFRRNDINFYESGDRYYNLTYNHQNLDISPLNFTVRNFDVSIGVEWDHYFNNKMLINTEFHHGFEEMKNEHLFSYHAEVTYNSENEWYFPTRGSKFCARYSYMTDNFVELDDHIGTTEISAMWRKSLSVTDHWVIQPMLYGRLLQGKYVPLMKSNVIGGEWFGQYLPQQLPFAGVGHIELQWNKMVAAQMQTQFMLSKSSIVLLRVAAAQNADEYSDILKKRTMLGTSMSYYYNSSLIGPIGATVGYSNVTKEPSFYINLGFVF